MRAEAHRMKEAQHWVGEVEEIRADLLTKWSRKNLEGRSICWTNAGVIFSSTHESEKTHQDVEGGWTSEALALREAAVWRV